MGVRRRANRRIEERRRTMNRRWTDAMDAELRRLYPTTTAPGLARHFGVTIGAVRQHLRRIGLRRKEQPGKIHLTLEQTLWMRRNFPGMATAICALYLGVSESSVKRIAYAMGLQKTPQFMREAQAHAARRAKESHLRNGTYPPKGWYSPNLQKGQQYRFKRKEI